MGKLDIIYEVLKHDDRLITQDGDLLKNKIYELGMKMDKDLLKLLHSNEMTKDIFFIDIDGIEVFDKIKFGWVIDSKDFLPDSYTQYKNKIMITDDKRNSIKNSNDVVLSFPYKDCILEMDSTKDTDERNEVFFNEVLMKPEIDTLLDPKVLTNAVKYTVDGKKVVTEIEDDDNIIIKGNNLLAMYSLLPRYKGKIKLLYWDILFNTNNDIVPYNDSFKHSSWLIMMKNRLEVGKELLKSDGFIVVHCDKNEDSYLKVLMDEIFGRNNYITSISVKSSNLSGAKTQHKEKTILKNKDTLHVYSGGGEIKINPQYVKKEEWDTHYNSILIKNEGGQYEIQRLKDVLVNEGIITEKESIKPDIIKNTAFFKFCKENKSRIFTLESSISKEGKEMSLKNTGKVVSYNNSKGEELLAYNGRRISFLNNSFKEVYGEDVPVQLLGDLWTDIDFQNTQNEGGVDLPNGKKPEMLMSRIVSMFTKPGDIVEDSYFGSGTTGAVCQKMGRQYIGIEQLDSHASLSVKRLCNVINGDSSGISQKVNWRGGGSFVYCELANNSQAYMDKVKKANSDELLSLYKELYNSDFVSFRVDFNELEKQQDGFSYLPEDEQRKFLISVIDKNTLYINLSDIDNGDFNIAENDKKFTKSFYEMKG